jgi:hypothetical protein
LSKLRFPGSREFPEWSDRWERRIRSGIVIAVVLLLLVQGALQIPAIRYWLSATDRLEGVPYEWNSR